MVRSEKRVDAPVRVLRPGESTLIDRNITELEIVLFRPLQPHPMSPMRRSTEIPAAPAAAKTAERHSVGSTVTSVDSPSRRETVGQHDTSSNDGNARPGMGVGIHTLSAADTPVSSRPPLFLDTTACVFYDGINKTDYVATGRATTDSRGVRHKPHAVVVGSEPAPNGYCNYNIDDESSCGRPRSRPCSNDGRGSIDYAGEGPRHRVIPEAVAVNSGVAMAAGDGVEVNFRKLSLCTGLLLSASLFTKDVSFDTVRNVYYMVRKVRSTVPICLVPVAVPDGRYHSAIAVMLRCVRLHGESVWELSNVNEPLSHKDVKAVVSQLEKRGLRDPLNYTPDFDRRSVNDIDERRRSVPPADADFIGDDEEDDESPASDTEDAETTSPFAKQPAEFVDLLANVPIVMREGRRQYNVGRPHVRGAATAGDDMTTDEDDEILDDALRAVVPKYADGRLVRYDDGAYNVGSRAETLVSHYVDHREEYALESAVGAASEANGGGGVFSAYGNSSDGLLAGTTFGGTILLPPLHNRASIGAGLDHGGGAAGRVVTPLDRCRNEVMEAQRLPLPPEFLTEAEQRKERRRSGWGSHQRRTVVAIQKKSSLSIGQKRSSGSKGGKRSSVTKRKKRTASRKRKSHTVAASDGASAAKGKGEPPRSRTMSAAAPPTTTKRTASRQGRKKYSKSPQLGLANRGTPDPGAANLAAPTGA